MFYRLTKQSWIDSNRVNPAAAIFINNLATVALSVLLTTSQYLSRAT
jgi:hypothetical protein